MLYEVAVDRVEASGLTLAMFWVATDLENGSFSVLSSSGLALGDDEVLDEEVETKGGDMDQILTSRHFFHYQVLNP